MRYFREKHVIQSLESNRHAVHGGRCPLIKAVTLHTPQEGKRGRADLSGVLPCRACDGQRQICLCLEIRHLRGDLYLEVWFLIVSESCGNFLHGKEQRLAWLADAMPWVIGVSFKFLSEITSVSLRLNQAHLYFDLHFRQVYRGQNKTGKCPSGLKPDKTFCHSLPCHRVECGIHLADKDGDIFSSLKCYQIRVRQSHIYHQLWVSNVGWWIKKKNEDVKIMVK